MAGHTSARPQEDSVFRAGPAGLRDMGITVPALLKRFLSPRLADITAVTVALVLILATQPVAVSIWTALPAIFLAAFAAIALRLHSTDEILPASIANLAPASVGPKPMHDHAAVPANQPHDLPKATRTRFASRLESAPDVFSLAPRRGGGTAGWSDLISRVSHELRTPLNAVIGFSDMMNAELLGPVENPRYREYLGHIRDSGRELLKSAEDTLAMTSLLADPCAPERFRSAIPLQAVAHDAWNFLTPESSWRGIRLDRHIPEDLEILAERRSLRQVLVNLFSEALRLAPDDGVIRLTADTDGECAEILIATALSASATHEDPPSLAICMARALLELHGTLLLECRTTAGQWQAVTVFDRALQPDFFPHSLELAP